MKSIASKLAVIAAAFAFGAGILAAQEEGHGPMHHEMIEGHGLGLPLHELNLTPDQHAQIKQIMQNEKGTLRPLRQQEMAFHQQLIQLVTSGNYNQTNAAAIAAQESQTHAQLVIEYTKIASQIYPLLSSDQKAKLADMIARHQQHMQEHMQGQQEPGSDQ